MIEATRRVLDDVERGTIGRREAVGRLVALAAATFAGGAALAGPARGTPAGSATASPAPTFQAVGLDHIALSVTDVARSRDFYIRHLGAHVLSRSESNAFLDVGSGHFLALFRADAPAMNHYCYAVRDYDADDAVARLRGAGIEPRRVHDRVYFDDPDGLEVQVSGS